MSFFRYIHNQKLFVHYLTIIIIVLGFIAFFGLRKEARPNVNFNRVTVAAVYPGASPSDIEELVIDPIEEKISEVEGIEEYRSVSYSGAGAISIKIDEEYPDADEVADEIRRKVSEVKSLPTQVEDPIVTEVKAINIPILRLALFGEIDAFDLKIEIEKLKDFLKTIPGVQSVSYTGLEDLQLQVLTDPKRLARYDLSLIDIINSLTVWSRQQPGGLIENSVVSKNVTIGSDYNDIDKLKNFIIRVNDAYQSVKISDIADVRFGLEKTQKQSIFGDRSAVLVTIVKKPTADIVDTVDAIKKGLDRYSKNLPDNLNYKLYTDGSTRVRDRLGIVTFNAIFGLILVLILLIVFLDWRSAIVTSMGIPIAVLGGIFVIYLLGNTMNSLVLVGIIIVLGMLVDDAIVVCENIYSKLEEGMSGAKAAISGVSEIAVPVLATVATTVLAFFPILFMKEVIGQFLRVIPLTVIAMLLISLFEALLILPVHATDIMKTVVHKESYFKKLEAKYKSYIHWSFKHKYKIIIAMLVLSVVTVIQGRTLFNRFSLFPPTGLEGLSVRLELKKNSPLKDTATALKELSKKLEDVSEGTFESIYSTAGEVTTGGSSGSRQNASHLGMINVIFTSDPSFYKVEKKILKNINQAIYEYKEATGVKTTVTLDRPGPPVGKPIQLQIASRDMSFGLEIVNKIKEEFLKMKGVHSLETDLDGDSKTVRFLINDLYVKSAGLNLQDISKTIFSSTTGVITSEILKSNEKIEILVGIDPKAELSVDQILELKIPNPQGTLVAIKGFVSAVEEFKASSIQRYNGIRTVTLFGEVDEEVISGKQANQRIQPFIEKLVEENPTIKIETGGGEKDRLNALSDTGRLYILAILLIFITISLAFKSVYFPFLVLLSVPMGLCGVVWSLTLHGQPLSLMGIVGIVGLSGVVVNVSILLLKYFQEKLQEGLPIEEALVQAGARRLRPILITTITTLVGLLPTIYGIGGVDTFIQPLALVLGWGLLVATLLTVFVLPALISVLPFKVGNQHQTDANN